MRGRDRLHEVWEPSVAVAPATGETLDAGLEPLSAVPAVAVKPIPVSTQQQRNRVHAVVLSGPHLDSVIPEQQAKLVQPDAPAGQSLDPVHVGIVVVVASPDENDPSGLIDKERGAERDAGVEDSDKPSIRERLDDVLNKPRESLELDDGREEEKDQGVEKERDIDRGPTHGL